MAVDVGVFSPGNVSVDLTNLVYMEADVFPLPIPNQATDTNYTYSQYSVLPFPATPPAPLFSVTLDADEIEPTITRAGWVAGDEQNARFIFSFVQTQSLDLGGAPMRRFWLVIHGLTTTGTRIVYGAGPIDIYESGQQAIYLPNNLAPLVIPAATILYVPANQQMPFAIPIDVIGTLDVEGVLVDVSQPAIYAPIVIPANTTFTVPLNQQVPFVIPISILGIMEVNGVLVDVSCPSA